MFTDIWVTYGPVKLTHKIDHHKDDTQVFSLGNSMQGALIYWDGEDKEK